MGRAWGILKLHDFFIKIFQEVIFFGDISCALCFLLGISSESQCRNLFF